MKLAPVFRMYAADAASPAGSWRSMADRVLVGSRRAGARVEPEVDLGVDHRDGCRVPAGGRVVRLGRRRRHAGMNGAELSGQHALVEASVARAQHRPAVRGELRRDTEPRRYDVPGVERAQAGDRLVCFHARRVECRHVLAGGAAVVEPDARIQRDTVVQGDRIACEERNHVRASAGDRRLTILGLEWASAIDVADATRDDGRPAMFASLELNAGPELVVRAQPRGLITIEHGLGGDAIELQPAHFPDVAARNPGDDIAMIRRGPIAGAGVVLLVEEVPTHPEIPHVLPGRRVGHVCERRARHRRMPAKRRLVRRGKRRRIRVLPELLMKALHHLQCRRQPPRQLGEHLVLFVLSRERRVRARLAVVVPEILVRAVEPEAVADNRTAQAGREIPVSFTLVAARGLRSVGDRSDDRLRRQSGWLPVVRRLRLEPLAALLGDDVDHGPLDVPELHRRADRLHVHFLDDVNARLGPRDAGAGTGEGGAVDHERVLVHAGSERGHRVDDAARRRCG